MPNDHVNPITGALIICEKWLADLDIERDDVMQLMQKLRPMEEHYAMVLGVRPKRQVKAALPVIQQALKAKAG